MGKLHIQTPYITQPNPQSARLCVNMVIDGVKRNLYYEVPIEYQKYLCTERSDAFLLSILQYAMVHNLTVSWVAPVTQRLLYQLKTIYMPAISERFPSRYHEIPLLGEDTTAELPKDTWAVATKVNGSVESFYTILKHHDLFETSYNLTHLLYTSVSFATASKLSTIEPSDINDYTHDIYTKYLNDAYDLSEKHGLPLIPIFSNEADFVVLGSSGWNIHRDAGVVYALQKLFSVYYFPTDFAYMSLPHVKGYADELARSHMDLISCMSVATDSLQCIPSGKETDRFHKLRAIQDDRLVQQHLIVCDTLTDANCSTCDACMRTMTELQMDYTLENYSSVFNLDKFRQNEKQYLMKMLYRNTPYDRAIIQVLEEQKKISLLSRILGAAIRPFYAMFRRVLGAKD
jgi:hypothetical protein